MIEVNLKLKRWEEFFVSAKVGSFRFCLPKQRKRRLIPQYEIQLMPSLIYGSGSNTITQLVLTELIEIYRLNPKRFCTVLDVGCGSGILAFVASRLGAKEIHAMDISKAAVELTQKNARLNKIRLKTHLHLPDKLRFDLIVSNLYEPVLCKLAPTLKKMLRPGGRLLLSGVLATPKHRTNLFRTYESLGFKIERFQTKQGWLAVTLTLD